MNPARALRTIRGARRCVETVLRFLRKLGDTEEHLPLATRFRRTVHRLETAGPTPATGSDHADLTVAFHLLNLLLAREFLP
jgi:hypothetical protein